MAREPFQFRFRFLDNPRWDTKIRSANVITKEVLLGFVVGPFGAMLLNSIINSYFNSYLTDVLGFTAAASGMVWMTAFMTLFPILSKLLDAATNMLMGKIIDMTSSRQGKIRPWVLISAPFVCGSLILIFTTPFWSHNIYFQAGFIVLTYNLFYAFSFTMWSVSREMLGALSTRNIKQRHKNTMAFSIMENAGTGMISMFFALIIQRYATSAENYLLVMVFFAAVAFPLFMVQYFYTRERVTEERRFREGKAGAENPGVHHAEATFLQQAKACFSDKMWIAYVIMTFFGVLLTQIKLTSLIYYSGWVVHGNMYGARGNIQSTFQMIALSPMGPGIILMIPLIKKFGRTRCVELGCVLSIIGSTIAFFSAGNTMLVYAGTALSGIGFIPYTYAGLTYHGDLFDHVEYKTGIRCDGFCVFVFSAITVACNGLALGIFNLGLNLTKYQVIPIEGTQLIYNGKAKFDAFGNAITLVQDIPARATQWINFSYQGTQVLTALVRLIFLLFFVRIDKVIDMVHDAIQEKERRECEALGIEYIPAQIREKMEIEEQQKEAEENRIKELKERCAKRGLDFETENQKYLDKAAARKAKKEKKAAAKAKK